VMISSLVTYACDGLLSCLALCTTQVTVPN
jgi:hypothetical protein